MTITSIYNRAMTIDVALRNLAEEITEDGVSISKRLSGLEDERRNLLSYPDFATSPAVEIGLNALVDTREKLCRILMDEMLRLLMDGTFQAIAYSSPNKLAEISQYDWSFLDMDFQKDCAAGSAGDFAQVRIIKSSELSHDEAHCLGKSEGLGTFKAMKNLTASELTVRLLYKDGQPLPDRMELSARDKRQTFAFNKIGLASDNGKLIREGQMLVALANEITPQNMTEKSQAQAMKYLRKIFRGIGIMDKDTFHPKKTGWQPRFKLIDAREQANKRAADRAIHVPYNDAIQYSQENDANDEWLLEHDKKLLS